MEERNIFGMVTSIISACINFVFIPLVIVFYALHSNTYHVVFLSIFYGLFLIYFIIKSIYWGVLSEVSKGVLMRIKNIFIDIAGCIITINFLVNMYGSFKWIGLGIICGITLFLVIIDAFNKFEIIRNILLGIISLILIILISNLYYLNLIPFLGIISVTLFFVGNVFNRKVLLLFDIVSSILFGLFLLLT